MNEVCPTRLTQARELAGLSKTDLAVSLEVSPAAVAQWESGVKRPTGENLFEIARVLGVPPHFLFTSVTPDVQRKGPIFFRARKTAKTRRNNRRAERLTELVAEVFEWLTVRVSLPSLVIPEIETGMAAEVAATLCRRTWGLGDRPILKFGELLEAKGFAIVSSDVFDSRIDAYSCVVNGRPFIFLGTEKQDRARSRFDAAHELGHLLLHQHLPEGELTSDEIYARAEKEADRFAASFLMPAGVFAKDLLDPTLDGFLKLKPKWGVSVQAMVHRASELGIIADVYCGELFRQMGIKGWRRAQGEPFDGLVPPICPSLAKKSIEVLEANNVLHGWEIPTELPLPKKVLTSVFGVDFDREEPAELTNIIPLPKSGGIVQTNLDPVRREGI